MRPGIPLVFIFNLVCQCDRQIWTVSLMAQFYPFCQSPLQKYWTWNPYSRQRQPVSPVAFLSWTAEVGQIYYKLLVLVVVLMWLVWKLWCIVFHDPHISDQDCECRISPSCSAQCTKNWHFFSHPHSFPLWRWTPSQNMLPVLCLDPLND